MESLESVIAACRAYKRLYSLPRTSARIAVAPKDPRITDYVRQPLTEEAFKAHRPLPRRKAR